MFKKKISKMESSGHREVTLQVDNENQVLLLLRNAFLKFLDAALIYTLTVLHYVFLPALLVYSFWAFTLDQTWQISAYITGEALGLLKIIPLTVELWFWSVILFFEALFRVRKHEDISSDVRKYVYATLQRILKKLKCTPLSAKHAAALYTFIKRIPIFGEKGLPFPQFLFEDTFSKITFRKGAITMVLVPPTSFHLPLPEPEPEPKPSEEPASVRSSSPASSSASSEVESDSKSTSSKKRHSKLEDSSPTDEAKSKSEVNTDKS